MIMTCTDDNDKSYSLNFPDNTDTLCDNIHDEIVGGSAKIKIDKNNQLLLKIYGAFGSQTFYLNENESNIIPNNNYHFLNNKITKLQKELDCFKQIFHEYVTNLTMHKSGTDTYPISLDTFPIVKIYNDFIEIPHTRWTGTKPIKIYYTDIKMLDILKMFPNINTLEIRTNKITKFDFIQNLTKINYLVLENTNITVDDLKVFPNLLCITHDSTFKYTPDIYNHWKKIELKHL